MLHRRHTSALLRLVPVAAVALIAAACGGGGGGGGSLDSTLRYFPPDPSAVVVVSTDVDGPQFKNLDKIVEARAHRTLESLAIDGAGQIGISWEKDVKPLLGDDAVIGLTSPPLGGPFAGGLLLAFHASSGGKLKETLEKAHVFGKAGKVDGAQLYRLTTGGVTLAVDGRYLLAAEEEGQLRAALDRAHGGDHFDEAHFSKALRGLPADALLRAYGDVTQAGAIQQVARFREIPWFDAVRTTGAAVSFQPGRAIIDLAVNTQASRLKESDLPLATGDDAPEVLRRPGDIVSANRNQSLTTAFLFRAAEVAFPNSRFVRDVHALQRQLKIDFVGEVLKQFDGPSASMVSLDGKTFAARSAVSDPARLNRVLPRLGPHLPSIIKALQGLQSEGEALLFLFAPDVLVGQGDAVKVTPPAGANGLWHVTGLRGEGPSQLYFGVIGKNFVVGSSATLARQIATAPTEKVATAHGAADLRVDLSKVTRDQLRRQNLTRFEPLGPFVAWFQASRSQLHARLSWNLP